MAAGLRRPRRAAARASARYRMSSTSVDLPGAAHAGHRGQHAQRDGHVDVAQVVLARAAARASVPARRRGARAGTRDRELAAQVAAGQAAVERGRAAPGTSGWPPKRPAPSPRSTTQSAARIVSASCSTTTTVLPRSRMPLQRVQQPLVVARVQAHRRLVQHVEDALHARARSGRPGGCGAPRRRRAWWWGGPGSGSRRPPLQEARGASTISLQQAVGHRPARAPGTASAAKAGTRLGDGQPDVVGQAAARPGARPGSPGAAARPPQSRQGTSVRYGPQVLEGRAAALAAPAPPRRRRWSHAQHRLQRGARRWAATPAKPCASPSSSAWRALRGSSRTGASRAKPWRRGHLLERLAHQARAVALPGMDRPVQQRAALVGDDLGGVHVPAHAQPLAGRAGAVGAVEGEGARRQLGHRDVAVDAGQAPAVEALAAALDRRPSTTSPARSKRLLQRGAQALLGARAAGPAGRPPPRCGGCGAGRARAAPPGRAAAVHAGAAAGPAPASSASSCRKAPLRPRTTGASTASARAPGQRPAAGCAICSARLGADGPPQRGQCGRPSAAKSTRRWS